MEAHVDAVAAAVGAPQEYRNPVEGEETLEEAIQVPSRTSRPSWPRATLDTVDRSAVIAGAAVDEAAE